MKIPRGIKTHPFPYTIIALHFRLQITKTILMNIIMFTFMYMHEYMYIGSNKKKYTAVYVVRSIGTTLTTIPLLVL